ncbi:MAG: hypothetical protein ABIJ37_02430 [Pseudomonadota bacterium]
MKIRKVLLMVPTCFSTPHPLAKNTMPPIGLGYIASVIENMGIEVRILDCLIGGWEIEK